MIEYDDTRLFYHDWSGTKLPCITDDFGNVHSLTVRQCWGQLFF